MVPQNLRLPGSSPLAVELGLQASGHSLDHDRPLAPNLLLSALSDRVLVVEVDPGVIQGSWSKSMIKKMAKAQFWHDTHPPLFPTKSTSPPLGGDHRW
jgi:hypothetical protein